MTDTSSKSEETQMVTEDIAPPRSERAAARIVRDWRRKSRRREYRKGRQKGGTRMGSLLYAYAASNTLGWPWDGIRAALRRWT